MNTQQAQKKFRMEANLILSQYGVNSHGPELTEGVVITPFGRLEVKVYPDQREIYTILMQFTEPENFDHEKFSACFADVTGWTGLKKHNLRWDIMSREPHFALEALEDRLNNLEWLREPKNMELLLSGWR